MFQRHNHHFYPIGLQNTFMENIETIRLFYASKSDGLMEQREKKQPFMHLIMALNIYIYIFSPIRLGTYNSIWGRLSLVVLTKTTSSPRPQHSTTKQKESQEAVKLLSTTQQRGKNRKLFLVCVVHCPLCPASTLV